MTRILARWQCKLFSSLVGKQSSKTSLPRPYFVSDRQYWNRRYLRLTSISWKKSAYEIVIFLVEETKQFKEPHVYCIPFAELLHFYKKCGFKEVKLQHDSINEIIISKYKWCLNQYGKNVLLLKAIVKKYIRLNTNNQFIFLFLISINRSRRRGDLLLIV